MDHPLYFAKVGFIKSWSPAQVSKWDYWTDFMWFVQTILEVPLNIVSLQDMKKSVTDAQDQRSQLLSLKSSLESKSNEIVAATNENGSGPTAQETQLKVVQTKLTQNSEALT